VAKYGHVESTDRRLEIYRLALMVVTAARYWMDAFRVLLWARQLNVDEACLHLHGADDRRCENAAQSSRDGEQTGSDESAQSWLLIKAQFGSARVMSGSLGRTSGVPTLVTPEVTCP
jgi:hypothetical protein